MIALIRAAVPDPLVRCYRDRNGDITLREIP
jgi:hypothetical protein